MGDKTSAEMSDILVSVKGVSKECGFDERFNEKESGNESYERLNEMSFKQRVSDVSRRPVPRRFEPISNHHHIMPIARSSLFSPL